MGRFVDLSHLLEDGMDAYPGLGQVRIAPIIDHDDSRDRYQGKAEFYLGKIEGSTNIGTYLDAPFHRHRDGEDLSDLALSSIASLPGIVIRASGAIDAIDIVADAASIRGRAVLIDTGWSKKWGTEEYWEEMPYLSTAALDLLIEEKAALVGVDFGNVDDITDPVRPAHTRLLDAGVIIVENLADVGALPDEGFRFTAVPPRIVSGASFPVRAFAEIER